MVLAFFCLRSTCEPAHCLSEFTQIFDPVGKGEAKSADRLLSLIYGDARSAIDRVDGPGDGWRGKTMIFRREFARAIRIFGGNPPCA